MQKYQHTPQPRHSPILAALAAGTLALSLLLSALALAKANDTAEVGALQSQLAHLTTNYSNLQGDLAYLSSQLSQMAEGEQLLMEYDFSAVVLEDLSGAAVTFTAMPNTRQDGDVGILSVRRDGNEVLRADCVWDGIAYTATVPVPAADDYEYYFIQSHDTGGQEQQKLEPKNYFVANIQSGMKFDHLVLFDTINESSAAMSFLAYHAYLYAPPLANQDNLTWEQADLVIYHNNQEIHRTSILTAKEYSVATRNPNESVAVPAAPADDTEAGLDVQKRCVHLDVTPDLVPGDTLEARLELRLSNGMALAETLESWPIS